MGVGSELSQARERAGLSAEQIAERTKIQLHRIEALENNNFENLPAGVYLDGIVRAYAHEVAINPEPLVERVRYERAEAAKHWQAGPAGLDAFASEQQVTNDTTARTIVAPPDLLDLDSDPVVPISHAHAEPVRPGRGPGRFVLPLLLLLAAAGLGAYFYLAHGGFDLDSARHTDTLASSPQPAHSATAQATSASASATPVAPSDSSATREAEVVAGTSGPQERAMPDDPPRSAPRARPGASPSASTANATTPAPAAPERAGTAASVKDVSGSWTLATHVESSSYARFEGLQLGYDIQLEQAGNRVTGTGRKVSENGDGVSSRVQTPISVAGTINGDRLTLTFSERGARRPTEGKFVLLLDDGGTMRGRFSSSAARSSGTVEAHRLSR